MQHQEWYLGNKKYKVKIKLNDIEKTIEMYGSSQSDAINKAKMIHPKDCIIGHPKANQQGLSKYLGNI